MPSRRIPCYWIGCLLCLLVGWSLLLASPAFADPDSDFLSELFALTDEAAGLNNEAGLWLVRGGAEGLHPISYLERLDSVRDRLALLGAPERVRSVRALIAEALTLQRAFIAQWYEALEAGRGFESQLTSEYAHHQGLHRSHRKLLQAYAELRALFPNADEETLRSFRDHLSGLDLQ